MNNDRHQRRCPRHDLLGVEARSRDLGLKEARIAITGIEPALGGKRRLAIS